MRSIPLCGIALLLSMLVGGCAGVPSRLEPVDVTLSNIAPARIGILEQEYQIELRVQNPNNVAIPIEGLAFQIDINDKLFAKGVSDQRITLPRFGEVVVHATAVGNLSGVIGHLLALQRGTPERLRYRLKGRFGGRGGSIIPFDQAGDIELPLLWDSRG